MKHLRFELRHTADPTDRRAYKGGSSTSTGNPITTNTDRRQALSDAVSVGDGSLVGGDVTRNNYDSTAYSYSDASRTSFSDNSVTYAADAAVLQTLAGTLPDAVNFMVNAGADVIKSAGGSIVNLNRDSIAANTKSFDSVVEFGSAAIDKIMNASMKTASMGNDLAAKAVASYQPDSKNNADTAKYAMFAAAGLVALVLINNGKKA